ncbi:hypothetical protein ACKWTF_008679 [Chironomus riparius]
MYSKQFVASAVVYLLWLSNTKVCAQTGNSNISSNGILKSLENFQNSIVATHGTQNISESDKVSGLKFSNNYKRLLSESSSDLDIKNDSSEVVDEDDSLTFDGKKNGLKFDDFVSQKELQKSPNDDKKSIDTSFINVFKVPKSKMKKTLSTKHSSMKNEPVINDFNSELLFTVNDENLTNYDTYFHAFTHLYDHNKWDVNTFSIGISKSCLRDMKIYLNDLRLSKDWAVKVCDASGRYRGAFFFENSFWVGSKEFCYETNDEYLSEGIPELQFFVYKFTVKLEPVKHKQQIGILDVGQCLPKACSLQDVTTILSRDPASLALQQTITVNGNLTKANELNIIRSRLVPGNYSIWQDHKFYIFGLFILALLTLIIFATFYEKTLIAKGFNLYDEKDNGNKKAANKHHKHCENNNNEDNGNNNNGDKYEMNRINNNNNNNVSECEMNKMHVKNDLHNLGLSSKVLLCFAYGSNSKTILTAKTSSEDSLTCLHGLRFFTLLWTVLVHTYLQMFGIGENRYTRKISERRFIYQMVGNATYSVDTFFFISGLLVVLLFLKDNKKGKGTKSMSNGTKRMECEDVDSNKHSSTDGFWLNSLCKTLWLILYRFLRLTPAYFFIMVLTELSMKVTYNQAVLTPALSDHVNCNKYFYRNLLYVNNFYPLSEMCMMWSWYLANDFQFYVVVIILLLLSTRFFKFSAVTTICLLLLSWTVSIYISLDHGYTHKVADPFESFDFLYDKPWQRFGPYVMGIFFLFCFILVPSR